MHQADDMVVETRTDQRQVVRGPRGVDGLNDQAFTCAHAWNPHSQTDAGWRASLADRGGPTKASLSALRWVTPGSEAKLPRYCTFCRGPGRNLGGAAVRRDHALRPRGRRPGVAS